MTRRRKLMLGVAAVALALAAGGVALAKTSPGEAQRTKSKRAYAQLFEQRLAAHLGVGTAALDAARKAAIEDVIAQALKDGALTPTQAARLRERLQQGLANDGFGFFGHQFGFGGEKLAHHGALMSVHHAVIDAVAKALGTDAAGLKESLRSGKTIEQLARSNGTTPAALGKVAAAAAKPILDGLVKDGTLSQEKEDAFLQKLTSGKLGFGHKFGFRHKAA
ncbi:MAG: hypothetical protein LC750_04045 [Actinobacteria bacterium]|nr:hypothetical protein [Actinomycetota bacterium]